MNTDERHSSCVRWAFLATMLACSTTWGAGDADRMVEEVFGPELKRVRATSTRTDDAELAKTILTTASASKDKPKVLGALCDTAYDLGMQHPSGYDAAARAMTLKAEALPDSATESREKSLAARRKQYLTSRGSARTEAGEAYVARAMELIAAREDARQYARALSLARSATPIAASVRSQHLRELQAILRRLTQLDRLERQAKSLAAKLKTSPSDQTTRDRLILIYVAELDRPEAAVEYLNDGCDPFMRTYVPLTAKSGDDLGEKVCMELGDWYRSLVDKATVGKPAMLTRAQSYYELFLDKHMTEDLQRTKVEIALKAVETLLAKYDSLPPGSWQNMLRLVDVKKHTTGGPWKVINGRYGMVKSGFGRMVAAGTLTFPVVPTGSYEMELSLLRYEGSGPVGVYIPAAKTRLSLILGWNNGQTSAVSKLTGDIDDKDNVSVQPSGITSGKAFKLLIKVEIDDKKGQAKLTIKRDGKPYLWWDGRISSMVRDNKEPDLADTMAPAVAALQARVAVNAARIRVLNGKLSPSKGKTRGTLPDDKDIEKRARDFLKRIGR